MDGIAPIYVQDDMYYLHKSRGVELKRVYECIIKMMYDGSEYYRTNTKELAKILAEARMESIVREDNEDISYLRSLSTDSLRTELMRYSPGDILALSQTTENIREVSSDPEFRKSYIELYTSSYRTYMFNMGFPHQFKLHRYVTAPVRVRGFTPVPRPPPVEDSIQFMYTLPKKIYVSERYSNGAYVIDLTFFKDYSLGTLNPKDITYEATEHITIRARTLYQRSTTYLDYVEKGLMSMVRYFGLAPAPDRRLAEEHPSTRDYFPRDKDDDVDTVLTVVYDYYDPKNDVKILDIPGAKDLSFPGTYGIRKEYKFKLGANTAFHAPVIKFMRHLNLDRFFVNKRVVDILSDMVDYDIRIREALDLERLSDELNKKPVRKDTFTSYIIERDPTKPWDNTVHAK